jgi:hypothetical protein
LGIAGSSNDGKMFANSDHCRHPNTKIRRSRNYKIWPAAQFHRREMAVGEVALVDLGDSWGDGQFYKSH